MFFFSFISLFIVTTDSHMDSGGMFFGYLILVGDLSIGGLHVLSIWSLVYMMMFAPCLT
jgi:hypothetical protein